MENNLKKYLKTTKNAGPVYLQTYRKLRKLIVDGYWKNGEKIISEGELAAIMDIGRTSLRTALVLLYEDGYILTKQGKGSFVTYDPASSAEQYQSKYISLKKRLELSHPDIVIAPFFDREIEGDAFLDEKLGADGKKIRCFANVYSDKGKPLAYSQVFFIKGLAKSFDEIQQILIEKVFNVKSTFSATSNSDLEYIPDDFSAATNVLLVSSTWYNEGENVVAYLKDYYNNDLFKYKISQGTF